MNTASMMLPTSPVIILLNGASSSGKTLTAQALQQRLGVQCVVTGFDDIMERDKPFGREDGRIMQRSRRAFQIIRFQLTDGRLALFKQLHREVVELHEAGYNVVVETALMDTRALYDAAERFFALNTLFVGMKPPLEISEQWEAQRQDRPIGQARKHYHLIHAHALYDLTLDPSQHSPDECATLILTALNRSRPTALQKICDSMRQ